MKSLLITIIVFVALGSSAASRKTKCNSNETKFRSCSLSLGVYTLRISADKIILNDGTQHTVHDFPYPTATQWSELKLRKLKGRYLLTAKVWLKNDKAEDVQSLRWIISELNPKTLTVQTDQVIQKRRETTIKGKPGYINDPLSYHAIKPEPSKNKLRWFAGRHSALF